MIPGLKTVRNGWALFVQVPKAIKKAGKEGRDIRPAFQSAVNAWDDALEDGRLEEIELDRALEKSKVFILENFQLAEILWKLVKPIAKRIL